MRKLCLKNKHHMINRRALATVVTSAIVLSAVSVMGVAMLKWSNTSLSAQKKQIEEVFSTQTNKINEDLIFDNILFSSGCPSSPCVNVTMSNVGTIGLNVTTIKLINGTTLAELKIFSYSDAGIVPGGTFSTNASYSWVSGGDYDLTILTNRGNQFTTGVIAP